MACISVVHSIKGIKHNAIAARATTNRQETGKKSSMAMGTRTPAMPPKMV